MYYICYTTPVQKPYYASGFLYSLKTHKILLLQSPWSLIGGESKDGEDAPQTFQRVVSESLELDLKMKQILPVYDYFSDGLDKTNYVFYAEVRNHKAFKTLQDSFSWVSFSEIVKLSFPAHTKQDVIVGERVINAKWRDDQPVPEEAS